MKIFFQTEGGFGYFPGLNKPFEISSKNLPKEEAEMLVQLVNEIASGPFLLKSPEPASGADMIKYKIIIKDTDLNMNVNASDKEADPKVKELISYLKKKQKESRSK